MRKPTHRELLAFGRNYAASLKASAEHKSFTIGDPAMLAHYLRAANHLLLQSVRAQERGFHKPGEKA